MTDGGKRKCSACAASLGDSEGVKLWESWFCATCFIGNSAKLDRELTPEDLALLRAMGPELAGFLPPEMLQMVLVGFWRRATGQKAAPPSDELARCVGEIQRLCAFATFGRILNLLKTWQDTFRGFVEEQEVEIRDKVKRLTEGE